jgi:hypothetical protein
MHSSLADDNENSTATASTLVEGNRICIFGLMLKNGV